MTRSEERFLHDLGFVILNQRFGGRTSKVEPYLNEEKLYNFSDLSDLEAVELILDYSKDSPRLFEAFLDSVLSGLVDHVIKLDREKFKSDSIRAVISAAKALQNEGYDSLVSVRDLRKNGIDLNSYKFFSNNKLLLSNTKISKAALNLGYIVLIPVVRRWKFVYKLDEN